MVTEHSSRNIVEEECDTPEDRVLYSRRLPCSASPSHCLHYSPDETAGLHPPHPSKIGIHDWAGTELGAEKQGEVRVFRRGLTERSRRIPEIESIEWRSLG
jgi:hypothetical protein